MRSKIIPLFLLLSAACCAIHASDTAKETARLEKNWKALQARKLDVVPVPKFIDFKKPVELKKIVIVGNDKIPYFKVICEEITSRITDIGSKVPVTVSPKRVAGAYNIIINTTPFKHKRSQAYTITPVKDGVILQGKENALFAVVTLRFLITQEKGKTMIHTAKVLDYPDYTGRRVYIFAPWVWGQYGDRDPQKTLELAKPYIRAAFRHKINKISFCKQPSWRDEIRIHRYSLEEARKILEKNVPMKSVRLINDYARSLGIRNGTYYTTHSLGTKIDKNDPEYKQMMYWQCHDHYFSWGRLDLHRKKAAIILDYLKRSGYAIHCSHCVDGGFMDPESWSKRDKLTREKFGDDRAAADVAVYKEYSKDHDKHDIEFIAVAYPYTGSYLTYEGVRKLMGVPDTPQTRKYINDYLKKTWAYCRKIAKTMPKHVTLVCREEPPEDAVAYYEAYKGAGSFIVDWYTMGLTRDIGHTLPQEIRAFRSSFHEPIANKLTIATVGGTMLQNPETALSAEYSWNTAFPGWEYIDRTRNPNNYDPKKTALNALRAAEAFYGMKAGKLMAPTYDKLFSFRVAMNPVRATRNLKKQPDLLPLTENNHKQLLVALASADKAFKLDKRDFKSDSYDEFIEIYLQLKAAKVYSIGSLAGIKMEKAAVSGNFELCKKLHDQALKDIKPAIRDYEAAKKAVRGKYNPVHRNIFTVRKPGYWLNDSDMHLAGRLFCPVFEDVEKNIKATYAKRHELFAKWNIPEWFKQFINAQKNVYIAHKGVYVIEHFIQSSSRDISRNLSKDYRLCLPAPKVEMRIANGGFNFRGTLINQDLHKQPKEKLANKDWPSGDSFEIYLAPPASDIGKIFQFIIDPNGNLITRRLHDPQNIGIKYTSPYDFGKKIKYKVERKNDRWSFDLTIPVALIGAKPKAGASWKVLFGYNKGTKGKVWFDNFWSRPIITGSASTLSNYHKLNITGLSYASEPHVKLLAKNLSAENRTHDRGAGTHVTFTPEINTYSPLKSVNLSARFFDAKGGVLGPEIQIMKNTDVPASWQSPDPVRYQAELPHETMYLQLKAVIPGRPELIRYIQIGKIKAANLASGKAVPEPAELKADKLLSLKKGKISFTVKANWEGIDRRSVGDQVLFYAGSFQRKAFTHSDMLSVIYSSQNGIMSFIFASPNWKGVRLARALWKPEKGKAHKMEFTWDLTKAPVSMKIFCDGKEISTKRVTDTGTKLMPSVPLHGPADYQPVFGALPNGNWPFDGVISDIKY